MLIPPHRFPKIPTSLTRREAAVLAGLACGKRVVEIGSLLGASTVVLADQANIVFAVDPHEGYPAAAPRSTRKAFEENLIAYGVRERVIPIYKRAQDTLLPHADLVFIDYTEECDELIDLALARCRPRVLAVHGFGHKVWTKGTDAVLRWSAKLLCPIHVTDSLAVMQIPKEPV